MELHKRDDEEVRQVYREELAEKNQLREYRVPRHKGQPKAENVLAPVKTYEIPVTKGPDALTQTIVEMVRKSVFREIEEKLGYIQTHLDAIQETMRELGIEHTPYVEPETNRMPLRVNKDRMNQLLEYLVDRANSDGVIEKITHIEICEDLGLSKSYVARILQGLTQDGYIERTILRDAHQVVGQRIKILAV